MFRHLIEENNLKEFLSRGCINDTELEFIESLINPEAEVPEDKVINFAIAVCIIY